LASLFSHALTALAIGSTYDQKASRIKFFVLGCFCTVIPDADVLMFRFVNYEHPLGHRGFFHSFFFCLILSLLLVFIFYRKERARLRYIFFLFLCGASHALLDMLTNGGLGVAIFSPFSNHRYFFPWRPIQVSPIGIHNFFSEWGLRVLLSEMLCIFIPCLAWIFLTNRIKKRRNAQ
jgi:inner membrane protein